MENSTTTPSTNFSETFHWHKLCYEERNDSGCVNVGRNNVKGGCCLLACLLFHPAIFSLSFLCWMCSLFRNENSGEERVKSRECCAVCGARKIDCWLRLTRLTLGGAERREFEHSLLLLSSSSLNIHSAELHAVSVSQSASRETRKKIMRLHLCVWERDFN